MHSSTATSSMQRVLQRLKSLLPQGSEPEPYAPRESHPDELNIDADILTLIAPAVEQLKTLKPQVSLVPTGDGCAVFEWREADIEYSAEIDYHHELFMVSDNIVTDELVSLSVPYSTKSLVLFVTTHEMMQIADDE